MFVEVTANGRTYIFNLAKIIYTMEVGDVLEITLEGRNQPFRFSEPEVKEAIKQALSQS